MTYLNHGINHSTATKWNVNRPDETIQSDAVLTTSLPAAGALTVYQLRPSVALEARSDEGIGVTVRSLKPGFGGVVEDNPDVANPDGWSEHTNLSGVDFSVTSPLVTDEDHVFIRFRQE